MYFNFNYLNQGPIFSGRKIRGPEGVQKGCPDGGFHILYRPLGLACFCPGKISIILGTETGIFSLGIGENDAENGMGQVSLGVNLTPVGQMLRTYANS